MSACGTDRDRNQCAVKTAAIVSQLPTLFGQLVYLSALHDKSAGSYRHPALCRTFGCDLADETLRSAHQKAFQSWLALSLEDQHDELRAFLSAVDSAEAERKTRWFGPAVVQDLIPPEAGRHETLLFESDFRILSVLF